MLYRAMGGSVKIGNTSMDYIAFGKGARAMVIIPGLSFNRVKGTALPMAISFAKFSKDFRVYLFDRKDEVPEGYTISDIAEDTVTAMRELGIFKANIFGVSQGGAVAQYIAVNHPEMVEALTLGVTYSRLNETVSTVVGKWIDQAKEGRLYDIAAEMMPLMYSEKYLKKYKLMLPIIGKLAERADADRFRILAEACLTCDIYDRLDEVQCPTLVLGGTLDKVVGASASFEIAEKLGCEIHLYDNLGHAAYDEEKDFYLRAYDFFMKSKN